MLLKHFDSDLAAQAFFVILAATLIRAAVGVDDVAFGDLLKGGLLAAAVACPLLGFGSAALKRINRAWRGRAHRD